MGTGPSVKAGVSVIFLRTVNDKEMTWRDPGGREPRSRNLREIRRGLARAGFLALAVPARDGGLAPDLPAGSLAGPGHHRTFG